MSEEKAKSRRVMAGKNKRFAIAQKTQSFGTRVAGFGLTIDESLRRDVLAIRAASRKAGEDDGYIVRFLSMCETHIVGPEGFSLQNKAKLANGKQDKASNDIIEAGFKEWGKKGCCDVTGQYSWMDIQRLFIKTVAQDGACLVREVRGFPNKYGYALQLLEADHLDINYNRSNYNGNQIKHGVELDDFGRHIAYHILTVHPGDRAYFHGNTRYERIPAEELLFAYYPFRIGQTIGVPWPHAALVELLDLYNYREAEITLARVAASKAFAYVPDSEVEPAEDDEEEVFEQELEPGGGIVVPYGYDIKELNFKADGQNAAAFTKTALRGGASSLDVSYNSLANDLEGVNFSSLRHGVLEDRDNWRKRQGWMRETMLERVFKSWLQMALLSAELGKLTLLDFDRLNQPVFFGRRWDWVNPLQDEKANTEAINNRTRSPQSIIRERGEDPEVVLSEIEEWYARTKHLNQEGKANAASTQNAATKASD
jgi:lambda family phage portal protein